MNKKKTIPPAVPATTVAAVSTPPGAGGIAVIRVSGPDALSVARRAFRPANRKQGFDDRRVLPGRLVRGNRTVDYALAVCFMAPRSYTGEDMVEISCHGGPEVTRQALDIVLSCGASPAGPGEFTRRAFLNGKMDLAQAEAVADLVRAESDAACRIAGLQLDGALSGRLNAVKSEITAMTALIEANIDFSEEGIQVFRRRETGRRLDPLIKTLRRLVDSYEEGRLIMEGLRVAIIGPPNAGKSSLFNALCGQERVLVDRSPGTTRDTVEESVLIKGRKITFIDTAGIHDRGGRVERMGMERSRKAAQAADLAVVVLDGSKKSHQRLLPRFRALAAGRPVIAVNKCDLGTRFSVRGAVACSARTGRGVDRIRRAVLEKCRRSGGESGVLIVSARHRDLLNRALDSLGAFRNLLAEQAGEELLALELRAALNAIGKITGEVTDDDILNHIFSRFCIGK